MPMHDELLLSPECAIFRGLRDPDNILTDDTPRFFGSLDAAMIYASTTRPLDGHRYVTGYLPRFYPAQDTRLVVLTPELAMQVTDDWIDRKDLTSLTDAAYLIIAYGHFNFRQVRQILEEVGSNRRVSRPIAQVANQLREMATVHGFGQLGRPASENILRYNGRTSFRGETAASRIYDHAVAWGLREFFGKRYQGYVAWVDPEDEPRWNSLHPDPLLKRHITPQAFGHDVVIFEPCQSLCTTGTDFLAECDPDSRYLVPDYQQAATRRLIQATVGEKYRATWAHRARRDLRYYPNSLKEKSAWLAELREACPPVHSRPCHKGLGTRSLVKCSVRGNGNSRGHLYRSWR